MDALLKKLAEVTEKAEYLLRKTEMLATENNRLKSRVVELETEAKQSGADLGDLKARYEILRLAKQGDAHDPGKSEELKKRLNEYIREIDQCLKLIGD